MARRGFRKQGRGAIFVWESEGEKPYTTYRSSYQPQSDNAFLKAGQDPEEMTRVYDPATELVVVFVDTDKSMEVYREWLEMTRPAPGPDGLRRPLWLARPLRPVEEKFYLDKE